jgi:hypothetical protein
VDREQGEVKISRCDGESLRLSHGGKGGVVELAGR